MTSSGCSRGSGPLQSKVALNMQYDLNNIIKASDSVCETQLRRHSLDFKLYYLCYKLVFKLGS